ncbi:MAG TPA: RNA methyltransferase [Anaerolineae bacterium]|nr:RNA methyltransferase [Anaerolineae bacterium]
MITSLHNPKIKWVRSLLSSKKERKNSGCFVVEGVRLAEEVLQINVIPQLVLFSEELSERGGRIINGFQSTETALEEVSAEHLNRISDTETSQGILIVLPFVNIPIPKNFDFALALDNIRDPGNLGTILRSAAAFNVQAVFVTPGTTDIFAPKVVRSAMGAHFRLPMVTAPVKKINQICKQQNPPLQIYLADVQTGKPCWQLDLTQPILIIIGGEAHGAGSRTRTIAAKNIRIPMPGATESLNAAIATSILAYEVLRQRKS